MNLPEAIRLLQKDIDDPGGVDIIDVNQAEQLGIEALKRCELASKETKWGDWIPLPGETKD